MNTLELIKSNQSRLSIIQSKIPIKDHANRVAEIDERLNAPGIWDDNRKAAGLLKERQGLISLLDTIKKLGDETTWLAEYAEISPEEIDSLGKQAEELSQAIDNFELEQTLTGPHDNGPAIVTITAGSGGVEAANFALMLYRMYLRYADRMGFSVEIFDEKYSEEYSNECIDSVTFKICGENAYGYLKNENGIHRLVRKSPYSSADARHTSFAAVNVVPDVDDKIEIEIRDSDLEITSMTAGGPGGQAQNRIRSAIRIYHIPSEVQVYSRVERSQQDNKRIALKLLRAKLYEIENKKRNAEKESLLATQVDSSFGSQVRSYTLNPFQLIKDHRSKYETHQAESVLDGNLHEMIRFNLLHLKS